jgi:hypothetical protein
MINRTTLLALLTTLACFTGCDDDDDDDVDAARDAGPRDTAAAIDLRADVPAADATTDARADTADGAVTDAPPGDAASADAAAVDAQAAAPTWTQIYTQVIAVRCAPCHTTAGGTGISAGHLDMTTKAAAYMNLVNVGASGTACTGMGTRVVPGMAHMSLLYLKVSVDDPTPCGGKMPLGGPALTEEQAEMIEDWIDDDAPNN